MFEFPAFCASPACIDGALDCLFIFSPFWTGEAAGGFGTVDSVDVGDLEREGRYIEFSGLHILFPQPEIGSW